MSTRNRRCGVTVVRGEAYHSQVALEDFYVQVSPNLYSSPESSRSNHDSRLALFCELIMILIAFPEK
jgi:hypothetical protein